MTDSAGKHVFVSYVREDSTEVEGLCAVLEAAGIPYWRDRTSLAPGDAWKTKIREAIQNGSLVFLACFSDNSRARDISQMNEELTLAVEEFRKMPPGRTWLIPVRFDDGDVPDWDLGAGRVLSDLNYADLFGSGHVANAASLVTTIHGLMGDKQMGPAAALEAVQHATAADRTELVKRLTKEMLNDPQRRIQLDDLVTQEVQQVLSFLNDDANFQGPIPGNGDEQVVKIAEQAQAIVTLVEPFCASLSVAARWGNADDLGPWATGVRSFVQAACKISGGSVALLDLRHLPGVVSVMTVGLAGTAAGNWDGLRVLLAEQTVRDRHQQKPVPLLEATDPWSPFEADWVPLTLARSATKDLPLMDALRDFTEHRTGKLFTPVGEWLHSVLRPAFRDQLPLDEAYDSEFDRAEIMLGLISTDAIDIWLNSNPDAPKWKRSRWFGRSTWRVHHSYGSPLDDFAHDLSTQGTAWGPLRAGLFGGDQARAQAALDHFREEFVKNSQGKW